MSSSRSDVLHVMHVVEASGGGLMVMLADLCRGHRAAGLDVTVVHGRRPETSDFELDALREDGVRVIEVEGWGSRSWRSELAAARALLATCRSLSPEVVVCHSSFAGVAALPLVRRFATVFVPHAFASQVPGSGRRKFATALAERFACRLHSAVVCVSDSEGAVAYRRGARAVRVVHNGSKALDSPSWDVDPSPDSRSTVVGVGRLVPQRRPTETGQILRSVSEITPVEWLGGAGDGADPYARRAEVHLKAEGIPVSGWLSNAEVQSRMRAAVAYVHWTSWDGLPLTVLEALAADTVVVASDIEPNREVLGSDGVFSSTDAAAAEVRRLVRDPAYWRARVAQQRLRASAFTSAQMIARWNSLLLELVGADHATAATSSPQP